MFIDFDKTFHPSEEWKNEIVSDQSPCGNCQLHKEMESNPHCPVFDECNKCAARALWIVKCHMKLYWLEHGKDGETEKKEKKKLCPINNAPCCECIPGAYCAVEVESWWNSPTTEERR